MTTSRMLAALLLAGSALACSDDTDGGAGAQAAGAAGLSGASGQPGAGQAGSSNGGASPGGQAGQSGTSGAGTGGKAGAGGAGTAGTGGAPAGGQAGAGGATAGSPGAGAGGASTGGQAGQAGAGQAGAGAAGASAGTGGAGGSSGGASGGQAGQSGAGASGASGGQAGTGGAGGAGGAGSGGQAGTGGAGGSSASSKGTGGLPCADDPTKVLPNGHRYCPGTAGGAEFKFVLPADFASNPAPLRLATYIHGDGAGAYLKDSSAKTLYNTFASWLDAHHAIFVPVLALNKCSWWVEPSYTTCDINDTEVGNHPDTKQENAAALAAVFAQLRGAYDISDAPVYYYGASGGSIFLSGSFLPLHGHTYPGVFALNCGGSKPLTAFAWDTSDAALRAPTRLYFGYGAKDEAIIPGLAQVPPFFAGLKFWVDDHKVPSQSAHCVFDGGVQNHQYALSIWQASETP